MLRTDGNILPLKRGGGGGKLDDDNLGLSAKSNPNCENVLLNGNRDIVMYKVQTRKKMTLPLYPTM